VSTVVRLGKGDAGSTRLIRKRCSPIVPRRLRVHQHIMQRARHEREVREQDDE
jgi:hypothetical protein